MKLGAGWLSHDPALDAPRVVYHEVEVPRVSAGTIHDPKGAVFSTRREEYGWVAQQLEHWPRGTILSAGSGFNLEIHVLEYILANMGYTVTALDANAEALQMPAHVDIKRELGDLTLPPYEDDSFDAWVCISVVEHLRESDRALAIHEAFRVLHSGGLALLTTDHTPPEETTEWFRSAGFLTGPIAPVMGAMLAPPVSYIVAQRPL